MEPPPARAGDWSRLPPAVPVLPVARRLECGAETALVADLRPRRAAGRGRLVDGGLGAFAARGGLAIPPRHAPRAGAPDLCCDRLDAAAACRPTPCCCAAAAENHRHCA